jgi:polyisoprenyl-phosphate glycosyltransferase
MNKVDYSIVIPVYNSAEFLIQLHQRLQLFFKQLGKTFEVIFINDCSQDNSLSVLNKIYSQNENIIIADFYTNFGQQNALMCGFQYCTGNYIITMDDDLQHPPEEISKLVEKIDEGYDVVIGNYATKKDKFYKNLGSILFKRLNHKIFNVTNNLIFSSFRIIRREIINEIKNNKTSYPYVSGMLLQVTRNIANIEINHEKSNFNKSNYSFNKLVKISLNLLINYSTIPLRFFSYIGLIVSMLSLLIGIVFIINQLISGLAPPGWTSIVVLISFYNALILTIFFILGIYISRLLKDTVNQKPYALRKVLK